MSFSAKLATGRTRVCRYITSQDGAIRETTLNLTEVQLCEWRYHRGEVEAMDLSNVEILMVEDNQNDVELVLRALKQEKLNRRAGVLRDGAEALDFVFCRGRFRDRQLPSSLKVILLDLKLPKVDGLEVLQKIKSDPRVRSIPVVILSSSGEEEDIQRCYQAGANSYVVKPVDYDRFIGIVSDLGHFWISVNRSPR